MKRTRNAAGFLPRRVSRQTRRRYTATPPTLANLLLLSVTALAVAGSYVGAANATSKLTMLYSFTAIRGALPKAGLIADGAGNLYGTTYEGGTNNDGVAYELSPPITGKKRWTETVLYSFSGADGNLPLAGLIRDGMGNLYGTTQYGGVNGDGVVFELSPPTAGKKRWTETLLHAFKGSDGDFPASGLIADGAGNLYGTTSDGGADKRGVVFELSPPAPGKTDWTETVLHAFSGADGRNPDAALIADSAGNLYGTASMGGKGQGPGKGLVFELSPPAVGQTAWTETVLHAFNGADGQNPLSPLIFDGGGNLYGTTKLGGANNDGEVFELSPALPGQTAWTATVLYSFSSKGVEPYAGLLMDAAGNLFGTTQAGGAHSDGVVFELSPPAVGETRWTEKVLQAFDGTHGQTPYAGLIADGAGNLYGTTELGGNSDSGVAFKLTP